MADEKPPSSGIPGQPERRRPAPTIELAATEIASDPAAAPQASSSGRAETPRDEHASAGAGPEAVGRRPFAWLPVAVAWPAAGAAIAGVVLTLGIVWLVLQVAGRDSDSGTTDARIAQLEQQVAALSGRAPAGDPLPANRIAAIEAEMKSLSDRVGALGGRAEDVAAAAADARRRADANAAALAELARKDAQAGSPTTDSDQTAAVISGLADRVGAIEGRAKAVEAELAKRVKEPSDDRAARMAVVAAVLAAAVERGDPFAAELKAAQSQAGDTKLLAPLEAFAASGVPSAGALARELSGLEARLLQAAGAQPSDRGILGKLQANAERLVRIRPIDQVEGDQAGAIIARLEINAAHEDLPGALAELSKLPAEIRAPAQAWIKKAEARAAALAASRAFAADTLAALGKPSP